MKKTSSNENKIQENQNIILEKEYKLNKENISYIISIKIEEINSIKIIKIKNSQIINKNFYFYEQIIDNKLLNQIFNNNNNLEQNFKNFINIFEQKKVFIKNFIIDKEIILNLPINEKDNIEIKLLNVNKSENIIINELIEKYSSLEKEYNEMKNKLTNENNSLKRQIQDLNKNKYINNYNKFNFHYFDDKSKNNSLEDEKDDKSYLTIKNVFSSVWCILNLNSINYIENGKNIVLNLAAIGFSGGQIYLINLSTLEIHQLLKETNTIYSLCQFNNDSKYLICSLSSGFISIFILKGKYYDSDPIQRIQKPVDIRKGEINKVITLSNGDLAAADRGSISIWKHKKDENNNKIDEFEFFKELITDNDTCQLIEVNPNVFACAIYKEKIIKIFNNNGNDYPLIGTIKNVESHGNNSNGMVKINDRLFCSGSKNYFIYIVCVEPVQLIQKIKLINEKTLDYIKCLNISNNGFLFAAYEEKILQFKIINDENNNFVELEKFDMIRNKEKGSEAFITTNDGKIFYQIKHYKTRFYLSSFKTS